MAPATAVWMAYVKAAQKALKRVAPLAEQRGSWTVEQTVVATDRKMAYLLALLGAGATVQWLAQC